MAAVSCRFPRVNGTWHRRSASQGAPPGALNARNGDLPRQGNSNFDRLRDAARVTHDLHVDSRFELQRRDAKGRHSGHSVGGDGAELGGVAGRFLAGAFE